ncbi:Capsule polysaccharide biosynthesis protein [Mannheimia haemolytica]|uniref:Capsule polysaccharide biosynthesis protein n=1 Tax=Mannheimia haemolytica TaxID=75985 RepID=A0A448T697_MANHA|nr:capsule biosynthesis protein [Mannheimia haemolytica]UQX67676.1 capsule biosynthesis protein [Mannheimia haemolytica]STY62058.1 Capsule polysaccharide biosynthesis protein [Mannheimia haemolytica]VEI75513.1 Capsule polysaccharide biosynthesis protein [Mannheimia haemolytica]
MEHYLDELINNSQRILLLQGPIGSFFTDFALWLESEKKTVFKLNFNGGDEYFYPNNKANTFPYYENLDSFEDYLIDFCKKHQIDNILCFGDNRYYHKVAKNVCQKLDIIFWAFEEGYFRPEYITLEKWGVNAFSPLQRNSSFFLPYSTLPKLNEPEKVSKGFKKMASKAIFYYWNAYKKRKIYSKYQHHRFINIGYYVNLWTRSAIKRLRYWVHDSGFAKRVEQGEFGEFFIVPLQVYDDTQVRVHCDQKSVEVFLREVLNSFAKFAPTHLNLIIKHHPMDRGFIDYKIVIYEFLEKYPQLNGRVFYIHDVPLPVFLRHGKGMVTLNSTSGLSALLHNMPVKTLGRANYDFDGLTDQQDLAAFWINPQPPNTEVFKGYRQYHLHKTHINGNFYNKVILRYPYNKS